MVTGGLNVSVDSPERRSLLGLWRRIIESSDPFRCRLRGFRVDALACGLISRENIVAC